MNLAYSILNWLTDHAAYCIFGGLILAFLLKIQHRLPKRCESWLLNVDVFFILMSAILAVFKDGQDKQWQVAVNTDRTAWNEEKKHLHASMDETEVELRHLKEENAAFVQQLATQTEQDKPRTLNLVNDAKISAHLEAARTTQVLIMCMMNDLECENLRDQIEDLFRSHQIQFKTEMFMGMPTPVDITIVQNGSRGAEPAAAGVWLALRACELQAVKGEYNPEAPSSVTVKIGKKSMRR